MRIVNCILLLLLIAAPARACNVPVFRYALERWPADKYEVIVFHKGPLTPADDAVAETLKQHEDSKTNLTVALVDLSKEPTHQLSRLLDSPEKLPYPWLVVRYPQSARIDMPVWSGRLSAGAVRSLVDSPVRRELARRILAGESGVWVLLDSGDASKDDAAARLLDTTQKKLIKSLKLPERTSDPADRLLNERGPELRILFSVIRLSRNDLAESMFVRMLLHTEEDLAQLREPMVFAVFGRGRALPALIGKGITENNIAGDAEFLVGACRCEIKDGNPGLDLIMTVDWDTLIEGRAVQDPPAPDLVGLERLQEAETQPRQPIRPHHAWSASGLLAVIVVSFVGLLLVVAVATLIVMTIGNRRQV